MFSAQMKELEGIKPQKRQHLAADVARIDASATRTCAFLILACRFHHLFQSHSYKPQQGSQTFKQYKYKDGDVAHYPLDVDVLSTRHRCLHAFRCSTSSP
jgi:hypothetical protein